VPDQATGVLLPILFDIFKDRLVGWNTEKPIGAMTDKSGLRLLRMRLPPIAKHAKNVPDITRVENEVENVRFD
jgi:hypothetical protein